VDRSAAAPGRGRQVDGGSVGGPAGAPHSAVTSSAGSSAPAGTSHLLAALAIAGLGWLAMSLQEAMLYARPDPFGQAYVQRWPGDLSYALVFNLAGVLLVSSPMLLFWLAWDGRPLRPPLARLVHLLQLALLLVTLVLDQLDNEIMRFMGIHLTYGLVRTYYHVTAWGEDMSAILRGDRGGPGLPFLFLVLFPLGLWWVGRRVAGSAPVRARLRPWSRVLLVALPVAVPLLVVRFRNPGYSRTARVQPAIVTIYHELAADRSAGTRPPEYDALVRDYQADWFRQSGDTGWRFSDRRRPLVHSPTAPGTPAPGPPWNVIYLQLETFRGINTGVLRPDAVPSATPFIDRLARDSAAAYWQRFLSFGPPTVNGLMAGHCSIEPHSRKNITASFTYTALDCLPEVLRRHGYRAELFTGFDPDWDNESGWLRRWYDRVNYYDDAHSLDRPVFRRAAERIRALGRGPQPFMATVVSISNHIPFMARRMGVPEARFDLDPARPPARAIRNTMRYTDDVVRELIQSLQSEPWFAHTLVVVTGDHGYDLGEHGTKGQDTGWREAVWVPLIIYGPHPRLPRGRHDEPASQLDIAPTVADLLGIREPSPWMGASLLARGHTGSPFAFARYGSIFGEDGRYSMVAQPATWRTLLFVFDTDPLEHHDVSAAHPEVATALRRLAGDRVRLIDYLLEVNLVWSDPGRDATAGRAAGAAQPGRASRTGAYSTTLFRDIPPRLPRPRPPPYR
jgi:phosphoglycerol transferase MdoB-like AlkP superfamily enzyme